MILSPIVDKPIYFKKIFKELDSLICGLFFDYPFDILNIQVDNEKNLLLSAIKSGKIEYNNGFFYIVKPIKSSVAGEIEKMGGKYFKHKKAYKIDSKKIPVRILEQISRNKIEEENKIKSIISYYDDVQENIDYVLDNFNLSDYVDEIQKDLFLQLKNSLEKINIIPFEKTKRIREEISKNYTNNLKYYVRKFACKEIPIMRQGIEQILTQGYRASKVKEFLLKRYSISVRKAKFLAEQETRLFVSEYREQAFKENGVNMYIWSSLEDDRVRPIHAKLNGTVQSWNNPPIAEENGERYNAGRGFGCRCIALPYVPDFDLYPNALDLTKTQKVAIKEERG